MASHGRIPEIDKRELITAKSFLDEKRPCLAWRELPSPISIALLPAGVRLRFAGTPGRSYHFQRAPAITGRWDNIATATAPPSGLIEHIDASPIGMSFYRTAAAP